MLAEGCDDFVHQDLRRRRAGGEADPPQSPEGRPVEIDGALADDPDRSQIILQVEMGVAVRMACLELLTAERLTAPPA